MPGLTTREHDQRIDIDHTLRKTFGKTSFRAVQRDAIVATLQRQDVFLQAATSFGKSLCFQLPAVVDHGITIVVSPLLALMNNQLASLQKAGVKVGSVNNTTPFSVRTRLMEDLRSGHPKTKLLYVTPEYCRMDNFRKHLRTVHEQGELARIVIDEAHCISEWGHDFRPAFKQLEWFKREFPDVPMMCCTASATSRVRDDIVDTLGMDRLLLRSFIMTTYRPNLHFEIRFKSDDQDNYDDFIAWLRAAYARRRDDPKRFAELKAQNERVTAFSGIIYTLRRNDTETLAARLCADGVGAKPYHAQLSNELKDDHLAGWVANKGGYDVIVATTAFGMGIDKENVRFVVHWQIPKSFEGFYQEAGRAGRDGKASLCIMYYSREDRDRAAGFMARELENAANKSHAGQVRVQAVQNRAMSLDALVKYCENVGACRHKLIAEYFGDATMPKCDWACDWCKDARALARKRDRLLAKEEWCATQREQGAYGYDEYD